MQLGSQALARVAVRERARIREPLVSTYLIKVGKNHPWSANASEICIYREDASVADVFQELKQELIARGFNIDTENRRKHRKAPRDALTDFFRVTRSNGYRILRIAEVKLYTGFDSEASDLMLVNPANEVMHRILLHALSEVIGKRIRAVQNMSISDF